MMIQSVGYILTDCIRLVLANTKGICLRLRDGLAKLTHS